MIAAMIVLCPVISFQYLIRELRRVVGMYVTSTEQERQGVLWVVA